jgi:pimeloyl-ACP methyl ester carboxylesterase
MLLPWRRLATHARDAPPERALQTGNPEGTSPLCPRYAGGVSAGIEGWARDGASTDKFYHHDPRRRVQAMSFPWPARPSDKERAMKEGSMAHEMKTFRTVRSSDGTAIAFERAGEGLPLILVGGALSSGVRDFPPFVELARLLEAQFTVYRFDRRGRGDSGDTQPYAIEREVDDLEALIADAGGAAAVYGFSSGAVLAVEAAARGAEITQLAVLEPPLPAGDGAAEAELAQTAETIQAGRRGDAVASFLAGVGLPPDAVEGMRQSPEWSALEAMAHTLLYDGAITEDDSLWTERAGHVSAPTLVLFSEGTSRYLADSARRAAASIPNALTRTLPGEFHDVDSETLAAELVAFLAGNP